MSKEVKRQIILIQGPDVQSDYGDLVFVESVTNWDEVTEEEYRILMNMQWQGGFKIVERNPVPLYNKMAGLRTPRDYIDQYYRDQEEAKRKRAEEAAARAAKRLERDQKAAQKKQERERKKYEELKKKFDEGLI